MEYQYHKMDENVAIYEAALKDEFFSKFPELREFLEMRYAGNNAQEITSSEAALSNENKKYANSNYYYKVADNLNMEFIHFTSLKGLLSILQTNSIRLSSLNGMNDPNEIAFASEIFEDMTSEYIERQKKATLSFSFCEFNSFDKEIETNANNLDLWRFYGNNGEGVAIKFKIINEQKNWIAYHLSQIKYGKSSLDYWESVSDSLNEFNKKYPKFYINLARLLCFHKSTYYKNEQEVRLVFGAHYNKSSQLLDYSRAGWNDEIYPKVEKKGDNFYSYLPLTSNKKTNGQKTYFERAPEISIEKIYLGFKYKAEELPVYRGVINSLLRDSAGVELSEDSIVISEMSKFFR
jgi:hypothetical protein